MGLKCPTWMPTDRWSWTMSYRAVGQVGWGPQWGSSSSDSTSCADPIGAAFRPCWRWPVRPRPNGTQERWWLPSASSTGCAGWGSTHQPGTGSTDVRSEPLGSRSAELRILVRDTSRKKTDEAGLKNPPFSCVVIGLTSHSTGGVTVPIRVPTPTTTSTRSSIHFIEKPQKKTPLSGGADFRVLMVRTAGRSESLSQ